MASDSLAGFARVLEVVEKRHTSTGYLAGPAEAIDDPADRLLGRLEQAEALLSVITGHGFGSFSTYNPAIQQSYIWAIEQLVSAARVDALLVTQGDHV